MSDKLTDIELAKKSREYHQKYYRKNKELIKKLYDESKQINKPVEIEKEKSILCPCGGAYKQHRKDSHFMSHRHILFIVKNANKIIVENEKPKEELDDVVKLDESYKKVKCECGGNYWPIELKLKNNSHFQSDKHLNGYKIYPDGSIAI
jgi:hypothetical protein